MTKAMVSVGGRELVLLVTSPPLRPSAPLTRPTSANAGGFVPRKISVKNSSGQEVDIGSLRRVPPPFTSAPPSHPSMKMPRRRSHDRGAPSLKRYLLKMKVFLCCRRRLHPHDLVELSTKLVRSLSASTFSFYLRSTSGSALVC